MEDPSRLVQLEPSTMPLFGRKVFADVIKDLDMGSFWLRAAQINDECLYKRQTRRDTDTGRGHRRMEAETGAAPRQELLGTSSPAGTGREAWSSFSRGFRGVDFQPLELRWSGGIRSALLRWHQPLPTSVLCSPGLLCGLTF